MGWLGHVLFSWGSFSMICHWSCTDWEKLLPSTEYGVMIGRTVVGPDALVVRRRMRHGCGGGLCRCCE